MQVAYLSGLSPNADLVETMISSLPPRVDILLTCDWPQGFARELPSSPPSTVNQEWGNELVASCVSAAAPRYHFAASHGIFFSRAPYISPPSNRRATAVATRLICLGAVGTDARWVYACGPTPSAHMSEQELAHAPGATSSPFVKLDVAQMEAALPPMAQPQQSVENVLFKRNRCVKLAVRLCL